MPGGCDEEGETSSQSIGYCIAHKPLLLQPCGTGSHLYTANANTLRSRTLSSRSNTTLVGLAFGFCLASLIYILIIAHIRLFVKYFFAKSYIFPRRYLARTSSKEASGLEPPSVSPKFVMRSRTALHPGASQGLLLYPYCITL